MTSLLSLQNSDLKASEVVLCNLCGRDSSSLFCEKKIKGFSLSLRFSHCLECDLVYMNPRLPIQSLNKLYSSRQYFQGKESSIGYFDYFGEEAFRRKTAISKIEKIEKYLGRKGRILEIGCAAGFFLSEAKNAGWEVVGIDISKVMADYGKEKFGLNVITDYFENLGTDHPLLQKGSFDAVLCWGTLGTFSDPLRNFSKIHELLREDGIFVFNASNANSFTARVLKANWFLLGPSALHAYSRKCIDALLDAARLKTLDVRTGKEFFTLHKIITKLSMVFGKAFSLIAEKIGRFSFAHSLIEFPNLSMLEFYVQKRSVP